MNRLLPTLFCTLWLGLGFSALAAEPASAPAASTTEPTPSPAAAATEPSSWLQSFPADRRRALTGYPGAQQLLLWPPVAAWRGDLLLLPGPANSGRGASLLLPLADQLAAAGWRCWLLPREQAGAIAADSPLASVLALIRAEPAPATRAAGVDKPGLFLLAEADAATLALNQQPAGKLTGTVLLAPILPSAPAGPPPTQPVLEIDRAPTTPGQQADNLARIQHWQQQPGYQFHTLVLPAQTDSSRWLSRIVDGWLRKTSTAQQQVTRDSALKKQMTAQAGAETGANKP